MLKKKWPASKVRRKAHPIDRALADLDRKIISILEKGPEPGVFDGVRLARHRLIRWIHQQRQERIFSRCSHRDAVSMEGTGWDFSCPDCKVRK